MRRRKLITNHCETKHQATSLTVTANAASTRHETFDGRDHLVAPVIAVKEGVLNGMLVLYDEFSAYPSAWEGVPLPIYHPQKGTQRVTANTPDILQSQVVGRMFNVQTDESAKSLKGELWIDVAKATATDDGKEIMRRLEAGEPLEVSTGYYSDLELTEGFHNGARYDSIQRNMRPDHVALLPGKKGACSWLDGCGAPRLNEPVTNAVKYLVTEPDGTTHLPVTDDNGSPNHRLMGAAWAALHGGYRGNKYEGPGKAEALKKLKAMYKREKMELPSANEVKDMDEKQAIINKLIAANKFTEEHRAVLMTVNEADLKKLLPQESTPPPDPRKLAVDALISNDRTPWKEEHRAVLMTFEEKDLKAMIPAEPKVEPLFANAKEFMDAIPDPKLRTYLQQGIAANDRRRNELVTTLIANKSCKFTKAELEAMELEFLERLADSMSVTYVGQGTPRINDRSPVHNQYDGVPDPPTVPPIKVN